MVRGKGPQAGTVEFQKEAARIASTASLSDSEEKGLLDEKKELQAVIGEASDSDRAKGVDVGQIQNRIKKIDMELEKRAVEEIRGSGKDKYYREEREIEEKLVVGMPTRYEMENPHKCPGSVRKHMAWDARNKALIYRYVEIQRILRPEEPKSIEELRSEGGPRR
jgi:DNA gyrase/topoisomerase IV subunit A